MFICFHFSPWNGESCPNDVKDYVFAHFENPMIKSDIKEIFKTDYESLKIDLKNVSQDEWEHYSETVVEAGFQAVIEKIQPEFMCQFLKIVQDRYDL